QRSRSHHRWDRVGEQVGATALPEPVDDLAPAAGEAAGSPAQGLAKGARQDVDPVHDAARFVTAAPVVAYETNGVAVVNHHQGVVLVGQVADGFQVGDDAVHREHAVGGYQPEPRAGSCLQLLLEVGHVVVRV